MKAVTVAAFNSLSEAESLQQRLVAAGISAEVHSESRFDETLEYTRLKAGFHVAVPRVDFAAALGIVYHWNVAKESERTIPNPPAPAPRGSMTHHAGGASSVS